MKVRVKNTVRRCVADICKSNYIYMILCMLIIYDCIIITTTIVKGGKEVRYIPVSDHISV